MNKITLGIDPGIADTGFGVISDDGYTCKAVDFGSITTPAHTPLPERLVSLYKHITALLEKYQPSVVAIEQLFFHSNVTTAFTVGQARGVVMLALGQHNIPVVELTPLQVKHGLTGYGQATKPQMQQMVKLLLNLKTIPRPDDAADALAIAICGSRQIQLSVLQQKISKDSKKLPKPKA